ncbi:MAG: TetR/AcrR family transcriptional regulator [Candidatus Eremiobacteraeota bacterium]|nr:TetR/AcrR family transcriptional regulator [Candidatus Eremiobacteraeota bacterium]
MIESERHPESGKSANPEDTRMRILIAAREVIARKGKRGATTREIAEVAGVNEATLFRHFGTKEALIIAVAKHSCPDIKLRDVVSRLQGPVEEDLYRIAYGLTEHLESMIDMIRWSLVEVEYEKSVFAQETWRPQNAVRAVVTEYMALKVASGQLHGKPDELASVFVGMMFVRIIARDKFPESPLFSDREYALRNITDVFLNGVRSSK